MQNDESKSNPSLQNSSEPPSQSAEPQHGGQWDGRGLALSFGACGVLVALIVLWEKCG